MAQYRNESMGVVNVGGQFAAPKQTLEVDPKAPGVERLVKRGVLSEVKATRQTKQADSKTESKTEDKE